MGIEASSLDFACHGCKSNEVHVDPAASFTAPRVRRRSCSHVGESLRNIWVRTINEGRAIPSKVDFMVETVFAESEQEGYVEIIFPDGGRAIHHAVICDNLSLVEYLANSLGCDINATHKHTDDTPLLLAAQNGNLEIVKFLLGFSTTTGDLLEQVPADVRLRNACGETIADLAETDENVELLRLLSCEKIESDWGDVEQQMTPSNTQSEFMTVDEEGESSSPPSSPLPDEPSSQEEGGMLETEHVPPNGGTAQQMTGWLQKRRYKENRKLHLGKSTWSDRFVVLRDGWLCWGPNEVEVTALDQPMKNSVFNQAWNVHVLEGISATKSKAHRNFKIEIRGSALRDHRMYEFKAGSQQERDDWIGSINAWIAETSETSFVDEEY